MKVIVEGLDKDFIESIKFLEKDEKIKIEGNSIIIEKNEESKLRAQVNLLFRLIKINDNLIRLLSNL
jgi:tRNA threonylcarbamoyladenosine modification (KEOPS) complex  Pcc1 subunit